MIRLKKTNILKYYSTSIKLTHNNTFVFVYSSSCPNTCPTVTNLMGLQIIRVYNLLDSYVIRSWLELCIIPFTIISQLIFLFKLKNLSDLYVIVSSKRLLVLQYVFTNFNTRFSWIFISRIKKKKSWAQITTIF